MLTIMTAVIMMTATTSIIVLYMDKNAITTRKYQRRKAEKIRKEEEAKYWYSYISPSVDFQVITQRQ